MSNNNEYCVGCIGGSVIASIVIGIIAAILRYTAVITLTPAFLWVTLGVAIVYLGIALLVPGSGHANSCVCESLSAFLAGILGTVLMSVILLGVTFVATSVLGAIISGALLFFFSLTVTTAVCLIKCKYGCR